VNELGHVEAKALFSAYVDADLEPPALERFVAHVEHCDDCLGGLERFQATVDAVRALPRERAPRTLARQVLRRVSKRGRRNAMGPMLDGFRVPAEVILPIVLAAAIALLIHALP